MELMDCVKNCYYYFVNIILLWIIIDKLGDDGLMLLINKF